MGKDLGKRISQTLQKQNMTQKMLAEQICISEAMLSRYITGDREPKPDTVANMATALHTTSDYLLGIEGDEFNFPQVHRIIARNSSNMTAQEKKALINALFGEE
jgi:transcriptional regulator with XRE-family HTH domain